MLEVVSVRFRPAGKIYYFNPGELQLKKGDEVIVETSRGIEYGLVIQGNRELPDKKLANGLKPVLRVATEEDSELVERNLRDAKAAYPICYRKIQEHQLDMKLIDVEYTFDRNKILFYFTADGRVDFRELVKDLAAVFKTRVELRQVGVRDETKLLGGIGVCGRELCCRTYLTDFVPVSIKMAKDQNLSLNPGKISGVCGRLMCCLKHEQSIYEELNSKLPPVGSIVATPDRGQGEVKNVNVLRQMVKVVISNGDEPELLEYPVDALVVKGFRSKKERQLEQQQQAREAAEKRAAREAALEQRKQGKNRSAARAAEARAAQSKQTENKTVDIAAVKPVTEGREQTGNDSEPRRHRPRRRSRNRQNHETDTGAGQDNYEATE
ncbi:MAG: stage 0 sporulation family protein [Lachnospiraceae bacterium]|nr:stage 0 sporulation family protein [Lachnospiraceae bacterium]MDY5742797.1 stage 0 sporulation family protein [Lachnospiraceae bacterium]